SDLLLFHLQQCLFPLHAPTIPTLVSVLTNHSMARDSNRHRIRSTRSGHRPPGVRLADGLRNLTIRAGFAERDRLQTRPHAALECRRLYVDPQRRIQLLPAYVAQEIV